MYDSIYTNFQDSHVLGRLNHDYVHQLQASIIKILYFLSFISISMSGTNQLVFKETYYFEKLTYFYIPMHFRTAYINIGYFVSLVFMCVCQK